MKKKVCIRKDGVVFPYTPLLEAKGFAVDIMEVSELTKPVKVEARNDPDGAVGPVGQDAPADDDLAAMTKAKLIEYASRVFSVDLPANLSKPDMLAEIESLAADAAKASAPMA